MLTPVDNVIIGQVWKARRSDYKGSERYVRIAELIYYPDGRLREVRIERVNVDGSPHANCNRIRNSSASLFHNSSRDYGYALFRDVQHAA